MEVWPRILRGIGSYFWRFADQFFKEPETLHQLTNHKRAWVLNAMRAFGIYYEHYTKGNRDVDDLVHNLIRRYQLNRGLDMKRKIYLVNEANPAQKVKLVNEIQGNLGFIIRFAVLCSLREEELVWVHKHPTVYGAITIYL